MIKKNEIGLGGSGDTGNLLDLASTDEGGRVGAGASLDDFSDDDAASAGNQFAELGKGFVGIKFGRGGVC